MLSLDETGSQAPKDKSEMADSIFGGSNQDAVKEVQTKTSSTSYNDNSNEDKLKKLQNNKAISSDSFKNENER